jgi:hypothetical protein
MATNTRVSRETRLILAIKQARVHHQGLLSDKVRIFLESLKPACGMAWKFQIPLVLVDHRESNSRIHKGRKAF